MFDAICVPSEDKRDHIRIGGARHGGREARRRRYTSSVNFAASQGRAISTAGGGAISHPLFGGSVGCLGLSRNRFSKALFSSSVPVALARYAAQCQQSANRPVHLRGERGTWRDLSQRENATGLG